MDAKYWESATAVMDHVVSEGSGRRAVSYHRRGIAQLALHLEQSGRECSRDAVEEWLSGGESVWSRCKYKENRTAAHRLLEAMETGRVSPSPYSHSGPTDYSRLVGWSKEVVDSYASSARNTRSTGGATCTRNARFLRRKSSESCPRTKASPRRCGP